MHAASRCGLEHLRGMPGPAAERAGAHGLPSQKIPQECERALIAAAVLAECAQVAGERCVGAASTPLGGC